MTTNLLAQLNSGSQNEIRAAERIRELEAEVAKLRKLLEKLRPIINESNRLVTALRAVVAEIQQAATPCEKCRDMEDSGPYIHYCERCKDRIVGVVWAQMIVNPAVSTGAAADSAKHQQCLGCNQSIIFYPCVHCGIRSDGSYPPHDPRSSEAKSVEKGAG
jgi:uncharacterized coiled-coil protein SlyX